MDHLFTPDGEAALASVMRRVPLLAFDFDGTLAPIVDRPDDASVPDEDLALSGQAGARIRWPSSPGA
jgi:trehalose 6-phosphate phosphatase